MNQTSIVSRLREADVTQDQIAAALGRTRTAATRLLSGQRTLKAHEIAPLEALLADRGHAAAPDYVAVEVLPTYAGMGGGGTGEGDAETALVSRVLVEDMLRGRATDFILVRVRGDSMEPDFRHGDELLCDRRDTSSAQPGPFALWNEGEYVIKNIERIPDGQVRIFSTNPKYTSVELANDNTRIIGRPVWFGRRL